MSAGRRYSIEVIPGDGIGKEGSADTVVYGKAIASQIG